MGKKICAATQKRKGKKKEKKTSQLTSFVPAHFFPSKMQGHGRDILPQLVICHKCGAILYYNIELKPPDEIVQSYDGKCPNCSKKLSFIPKRVQVKPIDGANQTSPLEPENRKLKKKLEENKETLKKREYAHCCPKGRKDKGLSARILKMGKRG